MISRKIELKRNSFFVFMLRVLPIIFWGGVLFLWAFRAFDSDVSRYLTFFSFLIAIIFGFRDLENNKRVISFSKDNISVFRKQKDGDKLIKTIEFGDVTEILCFENIKKVVLVLKNNKRYNLLEYNSAHMLGADKFFMVKAELCRYFPSLAHEYICEDVKSYIESGLLSEFIMSKTQMGRIQAGVLFFAELIFTLIPLGLSFIATFWVGLRGVHFIFTILLNIVNLIH